VRKVAGIAFLLYCGFSLVFVVAYLIAATEFGLPPGPPIVAIASVVLACGAVASIARRQR
jgi:hypothetical protein